VIVNTKTVNEIEVVILMATYNGDRYLVDQIQSIINQTHINWMLIIRDDHSSDNTISIINNYTSIYKNIIQIDNTGGNPGSVSNFASLYSWAKRNLKLNYLMFCDQDDIWLPNKIEISLENLLLKEQVYKNLPLLIYTDLELINEAGENLNTRINVLPEIKFNQIIAQNYCFGCTILLNKSLIELIDEIPISAENHDYWVALVAIGFGHAIYLNNAVILYRQHGNNVSSQGSSFKKRIMRYSKGLNMQVNSLGLRIAMLRNYYNQYSDRLGISKKNMLVEYIKAYDVGFVTVLKSIFRYDIWRLNFLQNIAFVFIIGRYLQRKR
jgi:glycosyltransferase involved in cell wall biosynthesis